MFGFWKDDNGGADLLSGPATVSRLYELVEGARQELWLVSPYATLGRLRNLSRCIGTALKNGAKVNLVVRDEEKVVKEVLADGQELMEAGVQFFAVEWLHAKVYWSPSGALLTSLNLLETSFNNSIEFGVFAGSGELHAKARAFIRDEIEPNMRALGSARARPTPVSTRKEKTAREPEGHCIRCGEGIRLNPSKPYCATDYEEWAEYENEDYEDRYCHRCGSRFPATMRKPLCRDCYRAVG